MLERTLVVLASEFSRDVLVEGKVDKRARVGSAAIAETMPDLKHYGMHAHFADAGSILLFGGGVKKGFVYGTTADEHDVALKGLGIVRGRERESRACGLQKWRQHASARLGQVRSTKSKRGKGLYLP